MSNTTILEEIESFLYTPYGLATLSGVVLLVTSLIWFIGCCIFCCCWKCHKRRQNGVTEAGGDLKYMTMMTPDVRPPQLGGYSTNSSGYQSNTGTLDYSTNAGSMQHDTFRTHDSMESILHS